MACTEGCSRRFTRSRTKKHRSRSFRTFIHPRQDMIEICPKFRADWDTELHHHPFGYLVHPSGNVVVLELHIDGGESYMTPGKMVAVLFGIKEPAEVVLTYKFEGDDSCFRLSSMKGKQVVDISSGDEAESGSDAPNNDNYVLYQHENDRVFGLEMMVSSAYASEIKTCPPLSIETCLLLLSMDVPFIQMRWNAFMVMHIFVRWRKGMKLILTIYLILRFCPFAKKQGCEQVFDKYFPHIDNPVEEVDTKSINNFGEGEVIYYSSCESKDDSDCDHVAILPKELLNEEMSCAGEIVARGSNFSPDMHHSRYQCERRIDSKANKSVKLD
ncbi:hypothetical protein TSUD_188810 [Trifolium subterraneum]|uniref:Uncharacterized protein n=1 Tax=Trifolium subterraneum TaxID=3900 RepID=A0A2Z6PCR7_TRISU|nr:hypothetical protein TSUD_188810 [Trifolium subterraneum]